MTSGWRSLPAKWDNLFRDHEIYVRTGGEVRFLRIGASIQRRVATLVLAIVAAWLAVTLGLLGWQAYTAWHNRDVAERAIAVEAAEARVAAESEKIEDIAARLDQRQRYFQAVFDGYFGDDPAAAAAAAAANETSQSNEAPVTSPAPAAAKGDRISQLRAIEARQNQLAMALTEAVAARSARAEQALSTLGIRPRSGEAQGGPFIPAERLPVPTPRDPAFLRLSAALERMESLEQLLVAVPSTLPASGMELSSGFGFRRDPFTGAGAMHAGLDFKGPHGSPIRAAAAGRVSFAGVKAGYGYVIEIDHGHGIMTRYAHLSGFTTRVGESVTPGEQIGRMGSTGRSTGTHLHFEVRVGGTAVNPRRFLEANPHVLEIKADARERVGARGPRA
jgi:murein DD-endopeptidase MepM/ murein hydrolase activator NlpD